MSDHDKTPAAEAEVAILKRIASLVAQLRADEICRQGRGSPYPLASLSRVEHQLSEAAQRCDGLSHAEVLKLRADLSDDREKCEARLKRSNRVDRLWSELLDLLWMWRR